MKAILTTSNESVEALLVKINAASLLTDQVDRVSTKATYSVPGSGKRVVLVDYGSKSGILRDLTERGCDTVVVPYTATADEIRHLHPDGILLSNGPGDPKSIPQAVETVRELIGEIPIFGICLGHQIFALACGANTEKMKFGHRGANHPVKDLLHDRCYITSQNHGYTVTAKTIAGTPLEVTHINNNDESIEGLRHKEAAAFSVQYHPEAAPGPYDSDYLFDEFLQMMDEFRENNPKKPQQEKLWTAAKQKGVKQLAEKY